MEDLVAIFTLGKVVFFLESDVLRDVHFTVFTEVGTICIDGECSAVIEAFTAFLKCASNDDNAKLRRKLAEFFSEFTWDKLSMLKRFARLLLGEVIGVEKFLSADDLSTSISCLFNGSHCVAEIGDGIWGRL